MTNDIHALATELDRIYPDQVDATKVSWGLGTEAGHVGHDATADSSTAIVGWFGNGGNVGAPVLHIHADDVPTAVAVARKSEVGTDLTQLAEAMRAAGVRVNGGEGCYIPDMDIV